MKHGGRAVAALAALTALAGVAVLPGTVGVASATTVPGYRVADDATAVKGTASRADAPALKPGLHTDSLRRGQQKYYAVTLDATTNAYFSVVAAPRPGTKIEDYKDQFTVSVQDSSGQPCGTDATPSFHGGGMAYPIADYATRRIGSDRTQCQEAGPYFVVLTREGSQTSGPDAWPVELDYLQEPAIKGSAPARPAPGSWSTATPPARTDATKRRAKGGTSFNDAGSVATGVWTDHIEPGETRFYRVPVDWGQRLNLSAELPNSTTGKSRFLANALGLSVYNPARGAVGNDSFVAYDNGAAAKKFTAPVDYGNRFNPSDAVSAMRFAGWYYLEVSLNPNTAPYFAKGADLTLRVDVRQSPKPGPAYASPSKDFSVTPDDREAAQNGRTAQEDSARSGPLMTVAYAGIGTGVVLLTGLGAWTLVARRSAAAGPPARRTPEGQRFGPPGGR
ncbi:MULTISPECIES: hypothetical protein [Streptomyces]|uniref:Uncharacterized protein n=1 Tax=Streptomyces siderophoricus TaxID=2802281 RepID=A0ABS1MU16_9ACTN|nr:hypothetical protein [Streptomyces sp. 9-7]MBL1091280.1 hypothetical protein [Streptomyces sp. 9-7]